MSPAGLAHHNIARGSQRDRDLSLFVSAVMQKQYCREQHVTWLLSGKFPRE